jgi:proteasome assembly chaperone (PAC2) family protein
MVCGIGGWVDGGSAATGTITYLTGRLRAKRFAEIPISRFHIYQVPGQESLRPQVSMKDGLLRQHRFPSNHFYYWVNPKSDRDLVLFQGAEPNLNWEEYADAILKVAKDFSVGRIYLLGGVLDRCPHTMEPNVSCSCTSPALKEEMSRYAARFSNYEGPGSFGTTLLYLCQSKDIEMVSMTTVATYYPEFNLMMPYNPKSIRALLKRLNHLLGLGLDLGDLDELVKEYEGKVDFAVSQSESFKAYVKKMEEGYQELAFEEPLEISGEEAVNMAERFLKGKDGEEESR